MTTFYTFITTILFIFIRMIFKIIINKVDKCGFLIIKNAIIIGRWLNTITQIRWNTIIMPCINIFPINTLEAE